MTTWRHWIQTQIRLGTEPKGETLELFWLYEPHELFSWVLSPKIVRRVTESKGGGVLWHLYIASLVTWGHLTCKTWANTMKKHFAIDCVLTECFWSWPTANLKICLVKGALRQLLLFGISVTPEDTFLHKFPQWWEFLVLLLLVRLLRSASSCFIVTQCATFSHAQ